MPLGSNDDYNEENVFDANSSSGFFSSSRSSPRSQSGGSGFDPTGSERFSRKVFVGGLPPDIGKKSTIQKIETTLKPWYSECSLFWIIQYIKSDMLSKSSK